METGGTGDDSVLIIDDAEHGVEDEGGSYEIERIIDERGKGKKKEYLCSWVDGAPPQWVAAEHLQGTGTLEDWEWACEELPEVHDEPEVVKASCATLAEWLRHAKRVAVLVGAGISAPILPTFRGKGGLWTRNAVKFDPADHKGPPPPPTLAHKALTLLALKGRLSHLASQNYDDILGRCGFPIDMMSELHGNVYMESCDACGTVYHRDFYVELETSKNHETGRTCDKPGCSGDLFDNIIHFGEDLPFAALSKSNAKFLGADLTISLGTSLQVTPAANLPFKAKRRSRRKGNRAKAVIVNLQATPRDDDADLIIHATSNEVMDSLARALYGEDWLADYEQLVQRETESSGKVKAADRDAGGDDGDDGGSRDTGRGARARSRQRRKMAKQSLS